MHAFIHAAYICIAGARAVAVCGGPSIPVLVGRQDATEADPPGRMVSEKAGVDALKANFAAKGLGVKEMVVLSGAHTLGACLCRFVLFICELHVAMWQHTITEPVLLSSAIVAWSVANCRACLFPPPPLCLLRHCRN